MQKYENRSIVKEKNKFKQYNYLKTGGLHMDETEKGGRLYYVQEARQMLEGMNVR
ncbi:hypothetical protein CLOSCI_03658 [[Clostridium] scindens ATCC 35704]|nr:hypothetical protein CLOSCI_03658 [[Clostridium] scindens ATCC 35704]